MTNFDTLDDGQYTAVVDSIEDGLATIFFERDGEEVADAVLDATILPADTRHADAIVLVTISDGELVEAAYDAEQTEGRAEQAQSRFDRLSERPPSDEDC
jgi:hypothetical protein